MTSQVAAYVLTVIGDDRSGLVSALSDVVARHRGNWERSQLSELAGKFAGIVLVTVPVDSARAMVDELTALRASGLDVTASIASIGDVDPATTSRTTMTLLGNDRPGIVRDLSAALASRGVSIEDLESSTREAPMAGGLLFEATATLLLPDGVAIDDLRRAVEDIAGELMVEISFEPVA